MEKDERRRRGITRQRRYEGERGQKEADEGRTRRTMARGRGEERKVAGKGAGGAEEGVKDRIKVGEAGMSGALVSGIELSAQTRGRIAWNG